MVTCIAYAWFTVEQSSFDAVIPRLRSLVELRMDFHIAQRHGAFGIRKELQREIFARDLECLGVASPAETKWFRVPLRQLCRQRQPRVVANQVQNAGQPRMILRVQINAEDARDENAVSHLKPAQFHVPDQLVNDNLARKPNLRRELSRLLHADTPP